MCAKHSSLTQTPPAVTCSHAPHSGDWRNHRASAFDYFSRCSVIEHASCLSKVPMVTWQVRLSEEVRGVHESTECHCHSLILHRKPTTQLSQQLLSHLVLFARWVMTVHSRMLKLEQTDVWFSKKKKEKKKGRNH